ncbi:hypothetical protein [Pseudoalteromonas obscura]|uniref:Uncharacterized protein n=1 Tax=Pseudoalteromonas obscura TaxID=3048491 RepID=A0ABT7EFI0_9GAMM|nr:hypothetical protein [Pseudoalteromonas sp. P94(2023)]MDK2594045.1 hypothetical protein [Pseudoalteromonas sp. P94(2023)]
MADVIPEEDVGRLVGIAKKLIDENQFSPIEIIKYLRLEENCSLGQAKEVFVIAEHDETLGQYQKRVVAPLMEEFQKLVNECDEE